MVRNIGGFDVYVCSVSAGRPEQVDAMHSLVGPLTWFVPPHQQTEYLKGGAEHFGEGSDTNVVPARQRAMDAAFAQGLPCIQFDDDLKRVARVYDKKWRTDSGAVSSMLGEFIGVVMNSDFKLGGIAPTTNLGFSSGGVRTRVFCRSHLWMVKPNELKLDENLKTKFDYDYSMQHIARYGGVCRSELTVWDFDFGTKKGGHVDTRTKQGEHDAIAYLQWKWGSKIMSNHPRREGEIIMRPPHKKRTVIA